MEENRELILLYQTPDGESRIEVRLEGETIWLNLEQMAELFQRNKSTISRHCGGGINQQNDHEKNRNYHFCGDGAAVL